MASNLFSRLAPTGRDRPLYRNLGGREDSLDVEHRAGLLDEENFNHEFQDDDMEHAERLGVGDSRATLDGKINDGGGGTGRFRSRGDVQRKWAPHDEDPDNDVPVSLLVERHDVMPTTTQARDQSDPRRPAIPGPSSGRSRAQWETAQAQQRLHNEERIPARHNYGLGGFRASTPPRDAKMMAAWRWANVSNLDIFIKDVYDYYQGAGIWCILLERGIHLVSVAFIAVFLTFLTQCIDYKKIRGSTTMSQILVDQCTRKMSGLWNLGLWSFAFYFIWKSIQYLLDMRRLLNVRDFYVELLNIPDHDMQTVTWQDVVAKIMALRDQNPKTATNLTPGQRKFLLGSQSKERLDASDIANRLMRRENYLIALFNKDMLDLTIPLPFLGNRQLLSRTLEWTLMFSILDFVFTDQGQVSQQFLKSDRRGELSGKLRRRFVFAGTMILVLSPFLAGYLIIVYFLTYYNEYQRNPSAIGTRTYTPLAEWKFREFNELPHLFRKRLNMSHPFATHYIDQFPKIKTEMVARVVAFMAGSLATVLAIVSLIDSENFLSFEITPDRTVLFYIGILGTVWAVAHGSVSEENTVFDPEFALRNVIEYTHYQPDHWQDRLHSFEVKKEFSELYKIKPMIFLEEILSILTTPFVLFFSLPRSSDQIIDFFREFTIHVDGLGYVCSFAEFDFKKGVGHAKKPDGGAEDVRDDYYSTKHGKMEMSYYGFMGNYGNYALNPKTGVQAHLPPGMRHQFHPPPAWPSSMHSPTLAADMQASRMGRSEHARSRAPARTPRFSAVQPAPSPMASILLDPHHQPPNTSFGRVRQRGGYHGGSNIIEESEDTTQESDVGKGQDDDEPFQSGGTLEESAWQTSPTKLSRESSERDEPHAGVVHMIYQFNQAQLNRRPGAGAGGR